MRKDPVDVFSRHAREYTNPELQALGRGEARARELLMQWLDLKPGERVLELGCGSGIQTVLLAQAVGERGGVVAIDRAPGMLELLREVATPNVAILEMDFERLAMFGGREFDAVAAALALQFCPDLDRTLAEIHRLLLPTGRLVAIVPIFTNGRFDAPMFERVRAQLPSGEEYLGHLARTREQVSNGAALRQAFTGAGFRNVRLEAVRATHRFATALDLLKNMAGWCDWCCRLDQMTEEQQEQARQLVLSEMQRQFGVRPIEVPTALHVIYGAA